VENLLVLWETHAPNARTSMALREGNPRSLLLEMGVGLLHHAQVKLATGLAGFSN